MHFVLCNFWRCPFTLFEKNEEKNEIPLKERVWTWMDHEEIFVQKVKTQLLTLWQQVAGPKAQYVSWNDFQADMLQCMNFFYYQGKKNIWTERSIDDVTALALIKSDVRPLLEKHAGGETAKIRYTANVQADFDSLWMYVRRWLDAHSATAEDRLQALLDGLHALIEKCQQDAPPS
jgi:hypothetical protein